MSQSPSLSTTRPSGAATASYRRARRSFRPLRLALFLLVAALLSLLEPNCFQFALRHFIRFEAWRAGVEAHIGKVGGSFYEPVTLHDSVWIYESNRGPVTRIEITKATATFSWRGLLWRSSTKWFQSLGLEGVSGKIQLPLQTTAPHPVARKKRVARMLRSGSRWLPAPAHIEASGVDFIFQSDQDYVRLAETSFKVSEVETGTIRAGQIFIKQPWLTRTFRNVRGTTKIEDAKLDIANLTLERGIVVRDLSAQLDDLAKGQLKLKMQLAAFGGTINTQATASPGEPAFTLDVTTDFARIGVASLANFLGVSEAAGGTIKSGRFTFRGPPQQFAKAYATLRLEAANFQWESRQWDSLVLGATLMNERIHIPELALAQGHNRLSLNGDMALPVEGVKWWQSEFTFNIAAKIDNLTELSALLLPEFKFAAGRANIDGSIRGQNQRFYGQLIAAGYGLRWRDAPIEELHASVKLNGDKYEITNLSLFNAGDFVRGRGVVNILGDKQYWGDLRASIQDLTTYAAILGKPIIPEPLAGGANLEWNGQGSAKGHSGKFFAHLNKVRSLGATAALLHPINADLEGTYAAGGMVFSRFVLADDDSSFTANVAVANKALSIQGMRLISKGALWLEGDALLPLDVWNAWPNTNLATLLDDKTFSKLDLTAYDLQLHDALRLTGWKFPVAGIVRGKLNAEGTIGALKTSGSLSLREGQLPLWLGGQTLTGLETTATFQDQKISFAKSAGSHSTGAFVASGEIDFTNVRDPALKLTASFARAILHPFRPLAEELDAEADLALNIDGPVSAGRITGTATITNLYAGSTADLAPLLLKGEPPALPPLFAANPGLWSAWTFDIACRAEVVGISTAGKPGRIVTPTGGTLSSELRLGGTAAQPEIAGRLTWANVPARVGSTPVNIETATLEFRGGRTEPTVTLKATGLVPGAQFGGAGARALAGEVFALHAVGPWSRPLRMVECAPPLTPEIVHAELSGENRVALQNGVSRFSLPVPAIFRGGTEIHEWPAIEGTSAASSADPTLTLPPGQ